MTDLYLPCPEPLKDVEQGAEDDVDTDGPSLVTSRSGHIIAVSFLGSNQLPFTSRRFATSSPDARFTPTQTLELFSTVFR